MNVWRFRLTAVWFLYLLPPLMLSACGRSDGFITIHGTATFDGEPVQDGSISLMPIDGQGSMGGGLIENGRFTADSPPGKMAVQVYGHRTIKKENPTQEEIALGVTEDRLQYLPPEYNQQSQLRIDVSASNHRFDFELNSQGAIPSGMGGT